LFEIQTSVGIPDRVVIIVYTAMSAAQVNY
jgi:hypothetical protein